MSEESKASFFRQSGWMMISAFIMGVCMWGIHPLVSKFLPEGKYGVVLTLLQFLQLIAIPTLGLQTVFARQTSAAVTPEQQRKLAGNLRGVMKAVFILWLILVGVVFVYQKDLSAAWKLSNPTALWVTVIAALLYLWWPILMGVVQGRQNFLWYGWASIGNGLGRVVVVAIAIFIFSGWTAGVMAGVWFGLALSSVICFWVARDLFQGPAEPIIWKEAFREFIPLICFVGVSQLLLSLDMSIVQSRCPKGTTDAYGAAGTVARSLVTFTGPIAAVMFPKLVRSRALSTRSNVLGITLMSTGLVVIAGALAVTLLTDLVIKFGFKPGYKDIAPIMQLFAWCMLPLTLTNVLIFQSHRQMLLSRDSLADADCRRLCDHFMDTGSTPSSGCRHGARFPPGRPNPGCFQSRRARNCRMVLLGHRKAGMHPLGTQPVC